MNIVTDAAERAKRIARRSGKQNKRDPDILYRGQPHGSQRCGLCTMFRAPNSCTAVAGTIAPHGWCKIFKRKS